MFKLMDEIWRIAKPEEDEEFEEIEAPAPRTVERERRASSWERSTERDNEFGKITSTPRQSSSRSKERDSRESRESKERDNIVNITTTTNTKVLIAEPKEFNDEVMAIADQLRDRNTIFLNLEATDENISIRILDFMAGVTYAVGGNVTQAAKHTYIITPYTVTLMDPIVSGLQEKGIFSRSDPNFMK